MCEQLLELYEYASSQSRSTNHKSSSGAKTSTLAGLSRSLCAPQVEGSPSLPDGHPVRNGGAGHGAGVSKKRPAPAADGGTPTDEATTPAMRAGEDEWKCNGGSLLESGDVKEDQGVFQRKKSRERPSESGDFVNEKDPIAGRINKRSRLAVEDGELQEQESLQ